MVGHPMGGLAMMGYRVVALAVSGVSIAVYFANARGDRSHPAEVMPELVEGR